MTPVTIGNATEKVVAIYALCEWPSGQPRYVGKTTQYLIDRRKAHIRNSRNPRLPVHYWLRKRINGAGFLTKLIEYVPAGQDWAAREKHWILTYKAEGADLLNMTDGGEGLHGHRFTESHKQKIAAALRTGSTFSCLRCGESFWRKANQIARGQNKYCSRDCSNKYNKGGTRDA